MNYSGYSYTFLYLMRHVFSLFMSQLDWQNKHIKKECIQLETNYGNPSHSPIQQFNQETIVTPHIDVATSGRVDFNAVDGMFQFHFRDRGERFKIILDHGTAIAATVQSFLSVGAACQCIDHSVRTL